MRLHVTQKALQFLFFSSFFFLIPNAAFGRTGTSFLGVFNLSLPKSRITSAKSFSLDTLAYVFVRVWSSGMGGDKPVIWERK